MTIEGTTAPEPVRFSIGRTIRDTVTIFGRNFVAFAPIALVMRLVWLLVPAIAAQPALQGGEGFSPMKAAISLMGSVVAGLTQTALVFGTMQNLRGQKATFNDVARGGSFAVPIVIVCVIADIPSQCAYFARVFLSEDSVVLAIIRLTIAIVGAVLIAAWWVSGPAIAAERIGILAALKRSAYLTKGRRWAIIALALLLGFAIGVPVYVVTKAVGLDPATLTATLPTTVAGVLAYVVYALSSALFAVLTTVCYYRLRSEKEVFGAEEIARIFE